jgi:hypothetical protein
MTKREAKRHACWEASRILQGFLDAGAELSVSDPYGKDGDRVREAMRAIVREMDRRGAKGRVVNG